MPDGVRALAERLVAIRSVSPDPSAEATCGRALARLLPAGIAHGEWLTADGRPVIWAFLPGRSRRTVLLLGHYDTVGIAEYHNLESATGVEIALRADELRDALPRHARHGSIASDVLRADLEEEARRPGTWMFGRGALDMKSGLAAAIAALEALAQGPPPAGNVLFVATPDEEHQSEGMRVAVPAIERLRIERELELLGALNLDYSIEPAAYCGVMGKLQLGAYVLGHAAHVGDPSRGADALQIAAAIVTAIARSDELVDEAHGRRGVAPAVLRLDDLKTGYSIEPVVEAIVEFNVLSLTRPVAETLERFRSRIASALAEMRSATRPGGAAPELSDPAVLTYAELMVRAGVGPADDPLESLGPGAVGSASSPSSHRVESMSAARDARQATLDRLRRLVRLAGLGAPAVVLHLLPPFYPPAEPGRGPLTVAARALAQREDLTVHAFYPFISDASYVAWRAEPPGAWEREFPSWGREYDLPWRDARALDLDVVNLGPWGRDAHGLFERVRADFAFERLPRLITAVVERAFEA